MMLENCVVSYLEEIEQGVCTFKAHYRDIRRFVEKHRTRASLFVHVAMSPVRETPGNLEAAGVREARALLEEIGMEHAWLVRAVVSASSR